jgi:NTP pyrophosphatase (non-canonical NTP hydrolase)
MDLLLQLQEANRLRCILFGHNIADWNPLEWSAAVAGEVGELCNVIKKLHRGTQVDRDGSPLGSRQIAEEAADVVIYLDILMQRCGLDLATAIEQKFNSKSEEIGSTIKIFRSSNNVLCK